ncbi:MAG: Hpt domain-containing protein [Pseudobacteriovorax sp.]|nr:Hpt domain-containing protein [Pseudobacteriovorax sp.]
MKELAGEWAFYWGDLLGPESFVSSIQPTGYLTLPADWVGLQVGESKLTENGHATYFMEFDLAESIPLSLYIPQLSSASRVFLNGELVNKVGQVGTDHETEIPAKSTFVKTVIPRTGKNQLVVQLSNYSYYYAGTGENILIGIPEDIAKMRSTAVLKDAVVFGAILIMVFYHAYLWWLRRTRISPLHYGLFCLAIGLRSTVAGEGDLFNLVFPSTLFELQYKIEFLGFAFAVGTIAMMVRYLYPHEFGRKFIYICAGFPFFWSFMILVTNANIYPRLLTTFQVFTIGVGFTMIFGIIRASLNKREGAKHFLVGFGIFWVCALNDLLDSLAITESVPLSHFGLFGFVLMQSLILSLRFDRAYDRAEFAEREVRSLNQDLEAKVAQRTNEINTILSNVQSAFLAIDRNGQVMPGFTASCRRLFESGIEAGDSFVSLLDLSPKDAVQMELAIEQIFDDMLPTEVCLAQLNPRVESGSHTLSLSGSVIRSKESQTIEAILLTITDATLLDAVETKNDHNEMLLNILQQREAFMHFLHDFHSDIARACQAASKGDNPHVRSVLHTIKGNLGSFGLKQTAQLVHHIEDENVIDIPLIKSIEENLEKTLQENAAILQIGGDDRHKLLVNENEILYLKQTVENLIDGPGKQQIVAGVDRLMSRPIGVYLGPIKRSAEQWSHDLGKHVNIVIEGAGVRVQPHLVSLLRNMVHLVRNAIDHGIELPSGRGDKPETAMIRMSFTRMNQDLEIVVEDDGAGLNTEKIRAKAVSTGIISADQSMSMSRNEIFQLIFHPQFSTAEQTSHLSGRGVGMFSVQEEVVRCGGDIRVESREGMGAVMRIQVPHAVPEDDVIEGAA